MKLTSGMYDRLKFIAQVLLPALGTLYFTLAGIWNLPAAEQVVGSIVALDTFLGVVLHISTTAYGKNTAAGTLKVKETDEGKTFSLELEGDPEYDLEGKDRVVFAVQKTDKTTKKHKT